MMKRVLMLLAIGLTAAAVQAATIGLDASKPTGDVLAQSDPDGTGAVGFDGEGSGVRHAWGQSFTVGGAGWTIDAITLQKHLNPPGAADAGRELKIAIFPMADFDSDTFGTFTDPFAGQTTVPIYVEIFDASAQVPQNNWVTFDLASDQVLAPGSYGFAVWLNGAGSTADWNWKSSGTYGGGQRLQVKNGNVLQTSDLNFVIQGTEALAPPGTLTVGDKPTGSILAEQSSGGTLLAFDAEERASNTRHSWGQSFTAVTDWSLSSVAVEAGGTGVPGDADALMKVAVFEYDDNTFTNDAWGTFSDPFSNATTTVLYEETFSLSNSASSGDWITMNLSSNVDLTAGNTYGFALWKSDPPSGSTATLKWGDGYNGGGRLRVHNDSGNTIEDGDGSAGDMNFVLQGDADLAIAQFEASATNLSAGLTATLSWFTVAADGMSIDLEGGANIVTSTDQSGSVLVSPPVGTNTYVMIATDSVAAVTSSVQIVVASDPDALLITSFDNAVDTGDPSLVTDTPSVLNPDFGTEVGYQFQVGTGIFGTGPSEYGYLPDLGSSLVGIGGAGRVMDGTTNDFAFALANDQYAEFTLDSTGDIPYYLNEIVFETDADGGSGYTWGIALLHDGDANGYDTNDILGFATGDFNSGTIVDNGTIDASAIGSLQGLVDPSFRFYFYENRIDAGSADRRFGITSLVIKGSDIAPITPAVFTSIEQVGGDLISSVSNISTWATTTLQATESLVNTNWVDIATTTGVSEVEWVLPTNNPVSFFRVISE